MTCATIDDKSSLKIAAALECQVLERQLLRVDEDEVTLAVLGLDHHIGRLCTTAANRYFLVKQMLVKTEFKKRLIRVESTKPTCKHQERVRLDHFRNNFESPRQSPLHHTF